MLHLMHTRDQNRELRPVPPGHTVHPVLIWSSVVCVFVLAVLGVAVAEHERRTQGKRRRIAVASSAPDGEMAPLLLGAALITPLTTTWGGVRLPRGVYRVVSRRAEGGQDSFTAALPTHYGGISRYVGTFGTPEEARCAVEAAMAEMGAAYHAESNIVTRQEELLARGHAGEQRHLIESAVAFARSGHRTMAVGNVLMHLCPSSKTGFKGVNDRRNSKGHENRINKRFRVAGSREDRPRFFDRLEDAATHYAATLKPTAASTGAQRAAIQRASEPAECIYDPTLGCAVELRRVGRRRGGLNGGDRAIFYLRRRRAGRSLTAGLSKLLTTCTGGSTGRRTGRSRCSRWIFWGG